MLRILFSEGTTAFPLLQRFACNVSASSIDAYICYQSYHRNQIKAQMDDAEINLIERYRDVGWVKSNFHVAVVHAGAGTAFSFLEHGVPLVIVPNLQRIDKHQTDIATYLQKRNYAKIVTAWDELYKILLDEAWLSTTRYINTFPFQISTLEEWINNNE